MYHIKLDPEFSPEACACLVAHKFFGWTYEKLENELKKLGEWEIYLKFKQDSSAESLIS